MFHSQRTRIYVSRKSNPLRNKWGSILLGLAGIAAVLLLAGSIWM